VTPENIVLTGQKDFFYRLVRVIKKENRMEKNKLAEDTEKGVEALNLQCPLHDSIYEIRIPRKIVYENAKEKRVGSIDDYFEFLKVNVFPMIEELEREAQISYWHILNHGEYLDLRIAMKNDEQKKIAKRTIMKHHKGTLNITQWPKYKDKKLGSRLGCQALLRLFHAQSKFTKEIVESIYWVRDNIAGEDATYLINALKYSVPIYTSHMQLNILPFSPVYEASAHLDEGVFRLQKLVEGGALPPEIEPMLEQVRSANSRLKKYI
jgi:hypothetical protein